MTYTIVKKSPFKFPTERYLNVVKRGYKDCNLDKKYLDIIMIMNKAFSIINVRINTLKIH